MTTDFITLPSEPSALARIISRHVDRCELSLAVRRTNWLLAWYYLSGYRRFDVFNPETNQIRAHTLDSEGAMEFQSQQLLYDINQIVGRIQSMDTRCKVDHQGSSLEGLRNKAIAQILTDSSISDDQVRRVTEEFGWLYTSLGFCGIVGHPQNHPTIGLVGDLEVVHPREILPFPVVGQDFTKLRGIVRNRWVPVEFLRSVYGTRSVNSHLDAMYWMEIDPGDIVQQEDENRGTTYWTSARGASPSRPGAIKNEFTEVARVSELWLYGPQNTVVRYICACGDHILQDQDLRGFEVYCPVGYARFFNNGTFHGAGMFDVLFSQHRQLELLTKSLYNNIRDQDRYGILVLPQGQINQNNFLRDVGHGLRVAFWDPDPVAEGFSPFPIQPWNTGDLPGRVAQFAREGLRSINPIQDLIQEKGRVDSATGLQFLEEQITRALTSPTSGIVAAFGSMYKSYTQKAAALLNETRNPLPVGTLTLDLAGAVIDPSSYTVSFDTNPIPSVSRLSFTIRAVSPRSTTARKQEAIQLWQLGIETDPLSFRLFSLSEGLDFAMWSHEDRGAYESSIRALLIVYGDGQTPGRVIVTPHTVRPELFLRVMNGFLTSPAMQVASPSVHNAMRLLRATIINFMGLSLPNAIPNPDDAAMLAMAGTPQSLPSGMGGGTTSPPME